MALTDNSNGTTMLVQPAGYFGGNGNGFGDGGFGGIWGIILLLLCLGNGMWGGFGGGMLPMMMGGMGGFGFGYDFPWLLNGQQGINNNMSSGFRDQMLQSGISNLQNAVTSGFGDVQLGIAGVNQNICQTGNGIVAAITGAQNTLSQQMYGNTIADMERSFALQSQGADLKYTVATENCADRTAAMQNTRDIIDAINAKGQTIIDKLCQLELDGVKQNAENRYAALEARYNQVLADNQALRFDRSQTAQNAFMSQGFANVPNAVYSRFSECPVKTIPICESQPMCGLNGVAA